MRRIRRAGPPDAVEWMGEEVTTRKARVLKTVVDGFVDALERAVAESGGDSRADKPTRR